MGEGGRVLFICQHNSGRSQMAEAYLKQMTKGALEVESAGMEPAERVNPLVKEVMKEEGMDLSGKKPRSVFELYKTGRLYTHVVTVCHDAESKSPVFPGITKRWNHPFPDPARAVGTHEEKLEQVRKIRDSIKNWLQNPEPGQFSYKELI